MDWLSFSMGVLFMFSICAWWVDKSLKDANASMRDAIEIRRDFIKMLEEEND